MKNKHLLLIGAGVLAIYLWKRNQDKKAAAVVVAPSTEASEFGGGCSNKNHVKCHRRTTSGEISYGCTPPSMCVASSK